MASPYTRCRNAACLGALLLVLAGQRMGADAAQKMTAAEVVQKHLASIGTPEARGAVRNRTVGGEATVSWLPARVVRGQAVPADRRAGEAVFVSEGRLTRLGLHFEDVRPSPAPRSRPSFVPSLAFLPSLDVAFDGRRLRSGGPAHDRGQLSPFVMAHYELIKDGLMGGTLTTAWALLDVAGRRPRLEYHGLKKLGGREYHELRYLAASTGGDMPVLMHFDPLTFRHVWTECRFSEGGSEETLPEYVLTEEFADFAAADGLTLPRTYTLRLDLAYRQGGVEHIQWHVAVDSVRHNQQLDPGMFERTR